MSLAKIALFHSLRWPQYGSVGNELKSIAIPCGTATEEFDPVVIRPMLCMRIVCHCCGKFGHPEVPFPVVRLPFCKGKIYCPECYLKFEEKFLIGIFALIPLMGLIGFICLGFNPDSNVGHVYLNLFFVQLFIVPSIVMHQFAHALVGRAAGLSVSRIWIGRGKTFFRRNILGFDTEFKAIPMGGFAFLRPKENHRLRLRFLFAVLAGPLSNAIVLVIVSRYVSWQDVDFEKFIQLKPIIFATQVFILVENLLPYKVQTGLGTVRSDGLFLFKLIFKKSP